MDRIDRKILQILQEDATLSVADIAEQVGLSSTPCWRRIQNLEKAGVIKRRVALLDAEKLNCGGPAAGFDPAVRSKGSRGTPVRRISAGRRLRIRPDAGGDPRESELLRTSVQ